MKIVLFEGIWEKKSSIINNFGVLCLFLICLLLGKTPTNFVFSAHENLQPNDKIGLYMSVSLIFNSYHWLVLRIITYSSYKNIFGTYITLIWWFLSFFPGDCLTWNATIAIWDNGFPDQIGTLIDRFCPEISAKEYILNITARKIVIRYAFFFSEYMLSI